MSERQLAEVPTALFPPAAERERWEDQLTQRLLRSLHTVQTGRVAPQKAAGAFDAALREFDFRAPRALDAVLDWTLPQMEAGIVQMSNPRYFGLFNPGANFPSQCADRIAALYNPQLASSASSPFPVALESHVIGAFARRAGFPEGAGGHFAGGGSEANMTALVCALTAAHPRFASDGARAFEGAPRLYTSRDCHIAWLKIVHQCGIGREALRLVDTDGCGRLAPPALEQAISQDRREGHVPCMIVATAGTTGGGMIDPLVACADIAQREGLWYHVDAAWGGAALVSDRLRGLLVGIERADSFSVDAHKWLAVTMGCALFITRRPQCLTQAFHAATSFMPSSDVRVDPYLNSAQWSRRFLGLRLFLTLACAGWQGLGAHVERGVEVIAAVERRLIARAWTVINASPLAVLNVLPPAHLGDVRSLVRRVVADGSAWVAPVNFEGRDAVRICATNGETLPRDIDVLVQTLNEARGG